MDSLLVLPKNNDELSLITSLLQRMKIETKVLTDDQKEELGLIHLMKQVDRTDKVSRSEVMAKLGKK